MIKYNQLLGKQYKANKSDCFSLLRGFYIDNYNITMRDYARPKDIWLYPDGDLYTKFYEAEDFTRVTDDTLNLGDVFLITIPDPRNTLPVMNVNHCAVYVGESQMIHHRLGQISSKQHYGGHWLQWTNRVIRHKNVNTPEIFPERAKFDILDNLPPSLKGRYKRVDR